MTYYPDNSWLKVVFELGIFGLWFLVIMIVSVFIFTRSRRERRSAASTGTSSPASPRSCSRSWSARSSRPTSSSSPMDQLFWVMIAIVATMAPEYRAGAAPVHAPGPPVPLTRSDTLEHGGWRAEITGSRRALGHRLRGPRAGRPARRRRRRPGRLAHFGPIEGARLLDLGCGTGEYSRFFARTARSVIAVDRSEVAVSTLRDRCDSRRHHDGRAGRRPRPSSSASLGEFDFVFGSMILHHIEPFAKFVDVLDETLGDGGRGFFYENSSVSRFLVWCREHLVGRWGIPKNSDDDEFPLEPARSICSGGSST